MTFNYQHDGDSALYHRLCELLVSSDEVRISVAWASRGGLALLNQEVGGEDGGALDRFLSSEAARLVITVGLSGRGTSYDALDMLLTWDENRAGTLEVFVRHTDGGGRIFHPKAYLFKSADGFSTLITGSNNLSRYGLAQSEEASLEVNSDNAPDAIESAMSDLFDAIEVEEGEGGQSRLLTRDLLEELRDSGYVLAEGSPAWRRNRRRQRAQIQSPLFAPTTIPAGLPQYGAGMPEFPGGDDEEDEYLGVPWGSDDYPVPPFNGVRFMKSATPTDIAGAYGLPEPEIRLPSHRGNQAENVAIQLGIHNVVDFFQYPADSGFANGRDVEVVGYRMVGEEVVPVEGTVRLWYQPSTAGGGSGYRLNFSGCEDILRCSTEGGGDIILIDRDEQDGYLFRFVPEEYGVDLLAQMNRENHAGTAYGFLDNGEVVEIPEAEPGEGSD